MNESLDQSINQKCLPPAVVVCCWRLLVQGVWPFPADAAAIAPGQGPAVNRCGGKNKRRRVYVMYVLKTYIHGG